MVNLLSVGMSAMNNYKVNLQDRIDLKNAVDLLIDCVSDEYKSQILDRYKVNGIDRERARRLYNKIDLLERTG